QQSPVVAALSRRKVTVVTTALSVDPPKSSHRRPVRVVEKIFHRRLISEITAAAIVLSVAATAAFVRRKVAVSAAVSSEPLKSLLIEIFGVAPCGSS
ncbi:hypothetical protein Tco_1181160, partial [Tanacetum coccineum]